MAEKKKLLSFNDFVSGSVAGIVQVLLGQPLDIIKVRMQTQNVNSLVQCAKDIFHKEGPTAFYKGTLSPLVGISFCVAIQFGANEFAKNYYSALNLKNTGSSNLSVMDFVKCGMIAGFFTAFSISPVELIRIKMQVQGNQAVKQYSSTIDCFKKIVKNHGLKGIYQGYVSTVFREVPAYAIYFGVYESLMNKNTKAYGRRENIPKLNIVMNGALAGVCLWLGTFPMDVIKSRIQADNIENRQYKSYMSTINSIMKENGIGGFWKGLTPCLIRAPPINAATFLTFELVSGYLKK
jgi:solute carrier family 25 carnitine/acylcarnitine transporter 20/29